VFGGLAADLVERAVSGGEQAFARFVQRSDDARIERIVGSDAGLRVLFAGMTQRYRPDAVPGFAGEVLYDLHLADGTGKPWTVEVGPERAVARPGRSADPVITMRVGVADFVRIAARDLHPGKALLTGRLQFSGDLAKAMRLGEMFGETSTF
jgi:hypothetical protein